MSYPMTHAVSNASLRAWGVGNLMTDASVRDLYYRQPGHPLSEETQKGMGGRFSVGDPEQHIYIHILCAML
jgi:hypothetical protein